LYGGSNTSPRFSFSSFAFSRPSMCVVGISGFSSSAGHSLISNYNEKKNRWLLMRVRAQVSA
jgi:hypothetical protein